MKTFRKSVLMQFLVMLFTVAIINVSCSKEALEAKCSSFAGPKLDMESVPDTFQDMLELAWAVGNTNDFDTMDEHFLEVFEDSPENLALIAKYDEESKLYTEKGFVDYVGLQVTKGLFSEEVKNRMINFSLELELLFESEPKLAEFISFLDSKRTEVKNAELCANDKQLLNTYFDLSQGYGQFLWPNEASLANGSDIDIRGCSWYRAILCGILALTVGLVLTAVGALIGATIDIFYNGTKIAKGEPIYQLFTLIGIALGIYAGISIYKWCCNEKDELPEQECQAPTGHYIKTIDCNTFEQTIFGPSNYGDTQWTNQNATPSSTITSSPVLEFDVPNYGEETTLEAIVSCINGTEVHLFDYVTVDTYITDDPLDVQWVTYPPSTIEYDVNGGANFTVKVNTPSGVPYEYDWSVNSPHTINGSGNTATIYVKAKGLVQTDVTVTNTCTGDSDYTNASTYAY